MRACASAVHPSQPIDFASLLISLLDDRADAGARCDYAGPDHCGTSGHPVSRKRAFGNLIDNAIKYGGCAHVRLEERQDTLAVVIADERPRIAPALIEEAFGPFRRLDPARSGLPGFGLGLTIARDVVSSHGGMLTPRMSGSGLEAVVELPRRALVRRSSNV